MVSFLFAVFEISPTARREEICYNLQRELTALPVLGAAGRTFSKGGRASNHREAFFLQRPDKTKAKRREQHCSPGHPIS